eukprot:m.184715 g.184715  ORF g.184715 m.184715 type:complete len:334 (+) comp39332_c1_seq8:2171-3172(+)
MDLLSLVREADCSVCSICLAAVLYSKGLSRLGASILREGRWQFKDAEESFAILRIAKDKFEEIPSGRVENFHPLRLMISLAMGKILLIQALFEIAEDRSTRGKFALARNLFEKVKQSTTDEKTVQLMQEASNFVSILRSYEEAISEDKSSGDSSWRCTNAKNLVDPVNVFVTSDGFFVPPKIFLTVNCSQTFDALLGSSYLYSDVVGRRARNSDDDDDRQAADLSFSESENDSDEDSLAFEHSGELRTAFGLRELPAIPQKILCYIFPDIFELITPKSKSKFLTYGHEKANFSHLYPTATPTSELRRIGPTVYTGCSPFVSTESLESMDDSYF